MRRLWAGMLAVVAGCQAHHCHIDHKIESAMASVDQARSVPEVPVAASTPLPALPEPLDLPALWNLAVANNPGLREAAASVCGVADRYCWVPSRFACPR